MSRRQYDISSDQELTIENESPVGQPSCTPAAPSSPSLLLSISHSLSLFLSPNLAKASHTARLAIWCHIVNIAVLRFDVCSTSSLEPEQTLSVNTINRAYCCQVPKAAAPPCRPTVGQPPMPSPVCGAFVHRRTVAPGSFIQRSTLPRSGMRPARPFACGKLAARLNPAKQFA